MKTLLLLVIVTGLLSCNKGLNGKIENRESTCSEAEGSKGAYIVNTSKDKSFLFTVRETKILNDKVTVYSTSQIQLAPGDEKELGCTILFGEQLYNDIEVPVIVDTTIYIENNKRGKIRVSNIIFDDEGYPIPYYGPKNYCTKDTSILKYNFHKRFSDGVSIFELSEILKEAKENKLSLTDYVLNKNMFIALPTHRVLFDKTGDAYLKIREPATINRDKFEYKYEVTGERKLKS